MIKFISKRSSLEYRFLPVSSDQNLEWNLKECMEVALHLCNLGDIQHGSLKQKENCIEWKYRNNEKGYILFCEEKLLSAHHNMQG